MKTPIQVYSVADDSNRHRESNHSADTLHKGINPLPSKGSNHLHKNQKGDTMETSPKTLAQCIAHHSHFGVFSHSAFFIFLC